MNEIKRETQRHVITVLRVVQVQDRVFRLILYGFVMLSTIGMGCKTEMNIVIKVLKKPVAPAIGFVCQYVFMPLVRIFHRYSLGDRVSSNLYLSVSQSVCLSRNAET